ncbi:hypothetical protein LM602_03675 [Candidatus Acetothermia bacterium]|jgi:hypothetical protein|nr:hypothetical protein [Candidatus Acetothermia bacterium]MCI2431641.1 hypothetical protein [Candidatus Acetothermia bacterium]MCI2436357.1 hypothetical protein [Candidatus Acetothermia bacterium]
MHTRSLSLRKTTQLLGLVSLALLLSGCPRLVQGNTVRIDNIDMLCRGAILTIVAFQGDQAIGNFEAEVKSSLRAEFVIPRAVANRFDFNQPVRVLVAMMHGGGIDCFLAKRKLVFIGKLKQTGTDPRTGNPVYTLNFWDDFKVEYR